MTHEAPVHEEIGLQEPQGEGAGSEMPPAGDAGDVAGRPGRPSVEERASRRDQIARAQPDRFRSLLWALSSGRAVPVGRRRSVRLSWNPIFWTLVRLALVIAILYLAVDLASGWVRQQRVETWSGPDTSVQSGQQLDSCPIVSTFRDATFPNWVRYGGSLYMMTTGIRPVPHPEVGATTYTESGYTLGSLRLLIDENTAPGRNLDYILLYVPPAKAARVYDRLDVCS